MQVLAGLPDDQRAALLAARAEGAMVLDGVDEVRAEAQRTRQGTDRVCVLGSGSDKQT